jgi:serine/threonine-protein kinase
MGEVYRARDLALDREVALKVLPSEFAEDPYRLARFAREARAAAALNHPNVLTVFEVGTEGRPFVAAELLTGHTLRALLGRPLPIERAVDYARQIAEGLSAAHAKGIVHRDIKPENLFVTSNGRVKILDFGVATHDDRNDGGTTQSTLTLAGAVIGTPGYMAPEQVRGEPADARADLFALGAVLHEMLTGRSAFGRDTAIESMTAILNEDPPAVGEFVPHVPSGVARVVQRCLAKAPDERVQSARDLVFALELARDPAPPVAPAAPGRRWAAFAAVAIGSALLAAVAGTRLGREPILPDEVRKVSLTFPVSARLSRDLYVPFTMSSDASLLAYTTPAPERLMVRRLDDYDTAALAGTDGAFDPFFSPDNQWVGYWAFGQIKKVPVAGGPAVVVCEAADMLGASWGEGGSIAFAAGLDEGLFIVPANGGTAQTLTTLDASRSELHHAFPQFIDGGRAVLFTAVARSKDAPSSVDVIDLATRARRTIVPGAQYGRYSPSGHLVYVREGNLFAVGLTPGTWEPAAQPVPVIEGVQTGPHGQALFSLASDGTLAYVAAEPPNESVPVWVGRDGAVTEVGLPARAYHAPRLSPDGKTMAVNIKDGRSSDIWIGSTERATLERLTFERGLNWSFGSLSFSPDGTQLAYAEDADGGSRLVSQAMDRSSPGREWLVWKLAIGPSRWLPNGDGVFVSTRGADSGGDLMVMRPSETGSPTGLVEEPGNQFGPIPSPDGRYVAYASDETGRFEIFATPYPGPGAKRQLTTDGAAEPLWSPDGREVFYRSGDRMMAIPVATMPSLVTGRPRVVFEGRFVTGAAGLPEYDVGGDGRFLMLRPERERPPRELRVVLNWFTELRQRAP